MAGPFDPFLERLQGDPEFLLVGFSFHHDEARIALRSRPVKIKAIRVLPQTVGSCPLMSSDPASFVNDNESESR